MAISATKSLAEKGRSNQRTPIAGPLRVPPFITGVAEVTRDLPLLVLMYLLLRESRKFDSSATADQTTSRHSPRDGGLIKRPRLSACSESELHV